MGFRIGYMQESIRVKRFALGWTLTTIADMVMLQIFTPKTCNYGTFSVRKPHLFGSKSAPIWTFSDRKVNKYQYFSIEKGLKVMTFRSEKCNLLGTYRSEKCNFSVRKPDGRPKRSPFQSEKVPFRTENLPFRQKCII